MRIMLLNRPKVSDPCFVLNWRLYEPGPGLLDRSFALPGVRRAS